MSHTRKSESFPSIVFVGVHMEACAPFRHLIETGANIVGLVTLKPESMRPVSGAVDLTPWAEQAGIPVLRVRDINEPQAVTWIREMAPALLLVVGWTQLLKPDLLRIPQLACLGFHASLLPKSRGRAPVNWALINGETITGNTMIVLEPEADSGDIVAQRTIPITEEDDCRTIYQRVGETEVEMLEEVLPLIRSGVMPRRKQDDSQATVMRKRRPEDGLVNWNRSTREIYNWVRALTDPYPGAFSLLNGEKICIWTCRTDGVPLHAHCSGPGEVIVDGEGWPRVSTADGWIRLTSVQREEDSKISGQIASTTFLQTGNVFDKINEAAK
jgi:methionyl-tRNA formyltransferase